VTSTAHSSDYTYCVWSGYSDGRERRTWR